jgi:uncharacterized protein (TIGR02246 family)
MPATRAQTFAVNDATYVAWNAHDAEAVAAVFAVDAVLREAGRSDETRGRHAIRDRAAALFAGSIPSRLALVTTVTHTPIVGS